MSTAIAEPEVTGFVAAPQLVKAMTESVASALGMCNCKARCVGVTSVPAQESGIVTGLIGVHGKVSGFVTLNLAERFAIRAVNGLLQESFQELNAQVVDGVGELTNIVTGGIKSALCTTPWAFSNITVPSIIVGQGYKIAYARGLEFVCTLFEHDDADVLMLQDRLLQVSISLLRL